MKTLFFCIFIVSACATTSGPSFKETVETKVHLGDSSNLLITYFGYPDEISPSAHIPGGQAWNYKRGGYICSFTVSENKIWQSHCKNKWAVVLGATLQGMGQGLQDGSRRSTTCTSMNDGLGNYNTVCH